jgi:hypothetical protein
MPGENAVFKAAYADFVLRKTRAVAVIQLEIPIEQAEKFVEIFGLPVAGRERWVALALMAPEVAPVPVPSPESGRAAPKAEAALKRAGMLPSDIAFRRWIIGNKVDDQACQPATPDEAAQLLRELMGVESRNEILRDPQALAAFLEIEEKFMLAAGRRHHAI